MELTKTEIKKMRQKQLLVTNALLIAVLSIYYFAVNLTNVNMATLQLIIGIVVLLNSIILFKRRTSTKSIFPIFEQVAIYEKEKMGKEWIKQKKGAWISNLFLSGLFFFQYYINRGTNLEVEIDFLFMAGLLFIMLLLFNVIMLVHSRKVDRSTSVSDFKGHTWKWTVFSVVFGLIFAVAIFAFIIFYAIAT